jgi:hypothetical protein
MVVKIFLRPKFRFDESLAKNAGHLNVIHISCWLQRYSELRFN